MCVLQGGAFFRGSHLLAGCGPLKIGYVFPGNDSVYRLLSELGDPKSHKGTYLMCFQQMAGFEKFLWIQKNGLQGKT